jgi:hypothetical protein
LAGKITAALDEAERRGAWSAIRSFDPGVADALDQDPALARAFAEKVIALFWHRQRGGQ